MPSSLKFTGYGPGKPRTIPLAASHTAVAYPYPVIYACSANLTLTLPLASTQRDAYEATIEYAQNVDVVIDVTTNTVTLNGQSGDITLRGSSEVGVVRACRLKPAATGEDYRNPNATTAY